MLPMNSAIDAFLRSKIFYIFSTTLLTYVFWWSGLSKIFNFQEALADMNHFALEPPLIFAIMTIIIQLVGSFSIITCSKWAWVGSAALGLFTVLTIPIAHQFWKMDGVEGFLEKLLVQEHFSVIGGLAVAAILANYRRGLENNLKNN